MLLKTGSKGDDVKTLQGILGLTTDGVFGPATAKAVTAWQSAHGLTADGIVGPATWSKMTGEAAARDESGNFVDTDGNAVEMNSASDVTPATPATDKVSASVAGLDLARLQGKVPDAVLAQIPEVAEKYQINSVLRLAHFLAQCAHESGNFKVTQENLNYSADGLRKIFGKYFPGDLADSYARQPEKIASRVYANRMGNGDEASKEGYLYRGRGYIQLTGKTNYASFNKIGIDDVLAAPDLVASQYPLLSAGWFWQERNINSDADKGTGDSAILAVTKKVNGGTNGLADRSALFKTYYGLLSTAQ
jgi:putative chitinase